MIIDFNNGTDIDVNDKIAIANIVEEAFWGKLKWFYGKVPKKEAKKLLMESLTYDLGFYYKEDGKVLGAVLLGSAKAKPFQISKEVKSKIGFWKGLLLTIFFNTTPKKTDSLYLNLIAVSGEARGKGIGKKLLDYADDYAKENKFNEINLDVVDNNPKAKKLYQREGYKIKKYFNTKWITSNMGFSGVYLMKKTQTN